MNPLDILKKPAELLNDKYEILYSPDNLGSFDEEWLKHRGAKEWWYATGVFFDEDGNLYSCQYTLIHVHIGPVFGEMAVVALTDFKNNRHYYLQCPASKENTVVITDKEASMTGVASAVKHDDHMQIELDHKDFHLSIHADYGKGAFWHCNDGKLQMGISGKRETTLYYSYTNMPSTAALQINGQLIKLTGKLWFDKQGGSYSIMDPRTNWEWFSLRFFDDEEVMLFTFPQDNYYDGTYIDKNSIRQRLNQYKIAPTVTDERDGLKWSAGWNLELPVKDKEYTLELVQPGHMNLVYFEELCYIKDKSGEIVGYCFVELLAGARNGGKTNINAGDVRERVEF